MGSGKSTLHICSLRGTKASIIGKWTLRELNDCVKRPLCTCTLSLGCTESKWMVVDISFMNTLPPPLHGAIHGSLDYYNTQRYLLLCLTNASMVCLRRMPMVSRRRLRNLLGGCPHLHLRLANFLVGALVLMSINTWLVEGPKWRRTIPLK